MRLTLALIVIVLCASCANPGKDYHECYQFVDDWKSTVTSFDTFMEMVENPPTVLSCMAERGWYYNPNTGRWARG